MQARGAGFHRWPSSRLGPTHAPACVGLGAQGVVFRWLVFPPHPSPLPPVGEGVRFSPRTSRCGRGRAPLALALPLWERGCAPRPSSPAVGEGGRLSPRTSRCGRGRAPFALALLSWRGRSPLTPTLSPRGEGDRPSPRPSPPVEREIAPHPDPLHRGRGSARCNELPSPSPLRQWVLVLVFLVLV